MPIKLIKSVALFGREVLSNPVTTGAICPSSPFLSAKVASFIDRSRPGWVVELGAGTGVVTRALLNHGVPPERLVSIEMSASLASHLREQFPDTQIIEGNAMELQSIVDRVSGKRDSKVDYVVSSLPFRSLPNDVSQQIVSQIKQVIGKTGELIQFTYDLRPREFAPFAGLKRCQSSIVLMNVPPARVDRFRVNGLASEP